MRRVHSVHQPIEQCVVHVLFRREARQKGHEQLSSPRQHVRVREGDCLYLPPCPVRHPPLLSLSLSSSLTHLQGCRTAAASEEWPAASVVGGREVGWSCCCRCCCAERHVGGRSGGSASAAEAASRSLAWRLAPLTEDSLAIEGMMRVASDVHRKGKCVGDASLALLLRLSERMHTPLTSGCRFTATKFSV